MTNSKSYRSNIVYLFEMLVCVFYAWYFLPICNALLRASIFKLLFFACFAVGIIGIAFVNGFRLNLIVGAVAVYYLIFVFLCLLDVYDANAHVRVSFTFWGTALLYFGALKDEGRIRIGKYLCLLLTINVLTSSIGVIMDNRAARILSNASMDTAVHRSLKMKNISSIYLFQCLIMFVPVLVCLPRTKKEKMCGIALLLGILFVLVNASFTISLLVYAFALFVSLIYRYTRKEQSARNKVVIFALVMVVLMISIINGKAILDSLAKVFVNEQISRRITGLSELLYSNTISGNAGRRFRLYTISLQTFLKNPFGIGPYYSYNAFENGLGYHSQLLDDLARYGIFAVAFYAAFFAGYYKILKQNWRQLGNEQIAKAISWIYFVLLILNLGFRSGEESVIALFIMPVLPLLLKRYGRKSAGLESK